MLVRKVAIWLLHDLRLHDHPALQAALADGAEALSFVYVWGPPHLSWGTFSYLAPYPASRRLHPLRERFLIESLLDLSARIRPAALYILQGAPHEVLPRWAAEKGISALYAHTEIAPEEKRYQAAVQKALQAHSIPLQLVEGNALYEEAQLPFPVESLPFLFTRFRQLVERHATVKSPLPSPATLPPWPETELTGLDFLKAHLQTLPPPPERAFVWQGGETAALKRLQDYLSGPVFTYKQTRNNFLGENFSSRLSPYLALGCLSPRQVYALLREAEKQHGANESTYWLFFELLWREYFRWLLKKEKGRFFAAGGLRDMHVPWQQDEKLFTAWVEGRTGYPIVDAAMRELKATAWTSNRARQIVASVFTKNLLMDWRWGASYFETALIDYDTASNWGNWLYQAGVGTDGRGFRWFDPVRQARLYDAQATYIKTWLPELRSLSPTEAYFPTPQVRQRVGYPAPIVEWQPSLQRAKDTWYRALRGEPTGNQLLRLWADED